MIRLIEDKRAEIEAICRRYRVRRLEVFGSAATGAFDPQRSDVDFLVEFEDWGPEGAFARYFGLVSDLEALLGRRIDLVMPSEVHNPFLKQEIDRTRTLVYAA